MSEIVSALGGACAALLVVGLVALVRRRHRGRADLAEMLDAANRESDDLRSRLDALTAGDVPAPSATTATYVITDAGLRPVDDVDPVLVPDRLVLSATIGAPLVKVAAFSHGVRRALSAEARNRIWFEMRREVRAARKRRKAAVREYLRETRAEDRAREGLA